MHYGKKSHKGNVRKINEDNVFATIENKKFGIAIVADGMGGHNAGEIASQIAIDAVTKVFFEKVEITPLQIRQAVEQANRNVFEYAKQNNDCFGMGTTLVIAVIFQNNILVANVGDSRAYFYDSKKQSLKRITKDHSLVEELLCAGKLTNEQAALYPFRNVITRAIGTDEKIKVDLFEQNWEKNDCLLLCSDGLTLHVEDEKIRQTIDSAEQNNQTAQQLCETFVELTLQGGAKDNVSVVVFTNSSGGEEA